MKWSSTTSSISKMSLNRSGGLVTIAIYPNGYRETIINLRKWCRDNKIDVSSIYKILSGKKKTPYKGFWFEKMKAQK